MKRLPVVVTFVTVGAVVLLSASLAYWGLQWFKPAQRALAAPPPQVAALLNIEAAKGLFGGQVTVAAVSNYQLKGVIAARGSDSAAIIVADGQPPQALGVGREVVPGVTVKEVHASYVVLSEGGVLKRVELASDANGAAASAPAPSLLPGAPGQLPLPQIAPSPQFQQQIQQQPQPQPQPQPPQRVGITPINVPSPADVDRTQ